MGGYRIKLLSLGNLPKPLCDLTVVLSPHEKANPSTTIGWHGCIPGNRMLLSKTSCSCQETGGSRAYWTSNRRKTRSSPAYRTSNRQGARSSPARTNTRQGIHSSRTQARRSRRSSNLGSAAETRSVVVVFHWYSLGVDSLTPGTRHRARWKPLISAVSKGHD